MTVSNFKPKSSLAAGGFPVTGALLPVGVLSDDARVTRAPRRERPTCGGSSGLIREKTSQKNTCSGGWRVWDKRGTRRCRREHGSLLRPPVPRRRHRGCCSGPAALRPASRGRPPLGPAQAALVPVAAAGPGLGVPGRPGSPHGAQRPVLLGGRGGGLCLLPAQTGPTATGRGAGLAGFRAVGSGCRLPSFSMRAPSCVNQNGFPPRWLWTPGPLPSCPAAPGTLCLHPLQATARSPWPARSRGASRASRAASAPTRALASPGDADVSLFKAGFLLGPHRAQPPVTPRPVSPSTHRLSIHRQAASGNQRSASVR